MTNAEIIATNIAILLQTGAINENNSINYVKGWNKKGFRVKKGATAITKFAIWYPKTKQEMEKEIAKAEAEGIKDFSPSRFKFVTTSWFTDEQVEPDKKTK